MYKILGKRKLDFTADDGRHIVGTTIWYGMESDSVEGYQVEKAFISPDVMAYKEIPLNEPVEISFNFKGRIQSIDVVIL